MRQPQSQRSSTVVESRRIGWLTAQQPGSLTPYLEALRQGLAEQKLADGQGVEVLYRYGEDDVGRVPELARELVTSGAELLIVQGAAIPLAIKFDGYYSQVLLSNPNPTAASATIVYKDQTSGATYTATLQVPANGTANHSVYSDAVVPEGFVGAATVTSTQPLAAVLFRSKMTSPGSYVDEDLYTAVNGVPTDRARTTARIPLVFRRFAAGGGLSGYNTWVSVAVADGGTARVTLTTVTDSASTPSSCAASSTYTTTKTITGSFVFYQNLDGDNGLGGNPGCLWGGMVITSDKPIIAIADATNDLFPGDNDGLFNAFGP